MEGKDVMSILRNNRSYHDSTYLTGKEIVVLADTYVPRLTKYKSGVSFDAADAGKPYEKNLLMDIRKLILQKHLEHDKFRIEFIDFFDVNFERIRNEIKYKRD